jgi:hypothetical protein
MLILTEYLVKDLLNEPQGKAKQHFSFPDNSTNI